MKNYKAKTNMRESEMARIRRMAGLVVLAWAAAVSGAGASIDNPEQVIRQVADRLLERVRGEDLHKSDERARLEGVVREEVFPHFDFLRMAKHILGKKNWTQASEEQRDQFVEEFSHLLLRTYASAIGAIGDRGIEYHAQDFSPDGKKAMVKTRVVSADGESLAIDYRLVNGSEMRWRVYDVTIDGISLIRTYRGEYASIIQKSGLPGLIEQLEKKNMGG